MIKTPENIMDYALRLARRAVNRTLPNPMVGSVVVKNGKIVGKGYHRRAGEPHAEVYAIESAGRKAKGATLFVTLEPCAHLGRTPPCTDLIIKSGIKKVIVSMIDPNPLVAGKGVKILRSHGIDVEVGVLESEARKLNEVYIKNITQKMPYVIYKSAVTLDGRTATKTGDSMWISSEKSRKMVHRLRSEVEAVMVGSETIIKDNPSLTTHGITEYTPLRIIVDSSLRIPLTSRVLNDSFIEKTIIATTNNAPRQKMQDIESRGVKVLVLKTKKGKVDLHALMRKLYELNIYRLLVEGGATLGGALLKEKLIDKIIFFIAPKLIGNGKGVFDGFGAKRIKYAMEVRDVIMRKIDGDIMIEGKL